MQQSSGFAQNEVEAFIRVAKILHFEGESKGTHDTCLGKATRPFLFAAESITYPRCSAPVRALRRPPQNLSCTPLAPEGSFVSALACWLVLPFVTPW